MNFYLSMFMFCLGITFLFRSLWSSILNAFLRFFSRQRVCQVIFLLALVCNLYILRNDNWMEYTGSLTLFVLTVLLLLASLLALIAEPMVRRIVNFGSRNYWFFALPNFIFLWTIGFWLLIWSYIGEVEDLGPCLPDDKLGVLCDISNAEDLIATPDQRFLIAPEFGGIGPHLVPEDHQTGRILMIDLDRGQVQPAVIEYGENIWGDRGCLRHKETLFSPHGMDLRRRHDNLWQLAVINHFPKESVEMFELLKNDEHWGLVWRGCISVPQVNYLNDISLASDGSFFVSHMYDTDFSANDALVASLFKNVTGYAMRWDSENGFSQVPSTEGAHPNGIIYDDVRGLLFVAYTFGDKIDAINMLSGKVESSFNLNSPDNIVLKDGTLWITSWDHSIQDMVSCKGKTPCTLPFSIYALEPNTLNLVKKWRFHHTTTGLPTVALPTNQGVWIGSSRSDRLVHFDLEWP